MISLEFFSFATFLMTSKASPSHPVMQGIPSLIIPAFSNAISSIVSPRMFIWSYETVVITETAGKMMLVESSLPPRPTSITAKSTFSSAKCLNAIAVVTSKNVAFKRSISFCRDFTYSTTFSLEIGIPSTLILSVKSTKCGEV